MTAQELREKIEAVKQDLKKQDTEHARVALSSYIDYLKDELNEAEIAERSNKGT
jgi:uncharacterized protein (DUF2267 family)